MTNAARSDAPPIDLDAAQALADAATPGPWESDGDYDRAEVCQTAEPFATIVGTETEGRAYMSYERLVLSAADSAFIAQARTLVPALIARVRDLEVINASLNNAHGFRLREMDQMFSTIERVKSLTDTADADGTYVTVGELRAAIEGGK